MPNTERPVILLVAEAVTLAHFGRIVTLARALDSSRYRIVVATDPRFAALDDLADLCLQPIHSISTQAFAAALARGKPFYSADTLCRYVEEDLALIDRVKPALVVGDFRLSLAISAPLRKVPYAAVVNGYWSPYAATAYPVPDLPFTRLLGVGLSQKLFDLARPLAFALHARPLNQARRRFGLPSLGRDLRKTYSWGDYTLYADIPEMAPTRDLPPNHRYLGPVPWSTRTRLPDWWDSLPDDKPVVCLTLGSSGKTDFLPAVIQVLATMPITLMVATLGKAAPLPLPANVYLADYLPMDAALRRSQLLVCNGGSLTTCQALDLGVPCIGICSNMDQLLNMEALARLGCGLPLRAAGLAPATLRGGVTKLLAAPAFAAAAAAAGRLLQRYDSRQRFRDLVAELLPP